MRMLSQKHEKCALLQVKVNTGVLLATIWSICQSQFCHACWLVKLAFSVRIQSVTGKMVGCCVLFGKNQTVWKSQLAESS
jgi:hypothetical protein